MVLVWIFKVLGYCCLRNKIFFNPLPDMPVFGSSDSAANKVDVNNMDKWGFKYLIRVKTWLLAIFPFPTMSFKSCLLLMH